MRREKVRVLVTFFLNINKIRFFSEKKNDGIRRRKGGRGRGAGLRAYRGSKWGNELGAGPAPFPLPPFFSAHLVVVFFVFRLLIFSLASSSFFSPLDAKKEKKEENFVGKSDCCYCCCFCC